MHSNQLFDTMHYIFLFNMDHKQHCFLQRAFAVRIQSATPLSVSDVSATNADVTSVTPVSGSTSSYDVGVMAKKSGVVAVSTLAAASAINVEVDTEAPAVRCVCIISHVLVVVVIDSNRRTQQSTSYLPYDF